MWHKHQGKLIILAVVGVSAALSSYAVWFQYQSAEASLAFWGRDDAILIGRASEVELLLISEVKTARGESLQIGEQSLTVVATAPGATGRRNLARGLTHIRRGLLTDHSFGDQEAAPAVTRWRYGLRFVDGDETLVVAFSDDGTQLVSGERQASTTPIAGGVLEFFEDHFPGPSHPATAVKQAPTRTGADEPTLAARRSESARRRDPPAKDRRPTSGARNRVPTRSPESPA